MGTASMVLGIASAVIALIPCCNIIAIAPAVIGLALGICSSMARQKEDTPKAHAVAGIVLNGAALLIIAAWTLIGIMAAAYSESPSKACTVTGTNHAETVFPPGESAP